MADINVQKRSDEQGRGLERRSGGSGFLRRHDFGLSNDLFSMSPFTLMRRLTEDMDRMFSGWGEGGRFLEPSTNWIPPIEVRESNGNLLVSAELPGLNKEDVKVEVNNDSLIIQGERKRETSEEKGGYHRSERSYGSFYREIGLPEGAKVDQAKAEFQNGVLEVRVPVPQAQKTNRTIPIEAGTERKAVGSETPPQHTATSKAG